MKDEYKELLEKVDLSTKKWLLVFSLLTIILLLIAILQEQVFPDWKSYRKNYSQILKNKASDELGKKIARQFQIRIEQNVIPGLNRIDRCITCHTGLEDPRMTDEPQPFTTHPGNYLSEHDPIEFGCTICHEGQSRATSKKDAHGKIAHWDRPILDYDHIITSCTRCHDENSLYKPDGLVALAGQSNILNPGLTLINHGKELMESYGCLGCHILKGEGETLGPDLSYIGDKTYHEFDFSNLSKKEPREVRYWLTKHFLNPEDVVPDSTMPNVEFTNEEAEALTAYMLTFRKAAPGDYVAPADADSSGTELSSASLNDINSSHEIP